MNMVWFLKKKAIKLHTFCNNNIYSLRENKCRLFYKYLFPTGKKNNYYYKLFKYEINFKYEIIK
jgi:hypothetical protein